MITTYQSLLSDNYLRAVFAKEFNEFQGSEAEKKLIDRLEKWSVKKFQKETSAESAFINIFFEETWGYAPSGKTSAGHGFTCHPKFAIPGAGASGGVGEADAALGLFDHAGVPATPQALCEFKDVKSNLDGPQKRKGNNRSPVKQCADYLREAMKPLFGNEAIQPTWGIVTDMNEFRLYWRNTMPTQYQRFIIRKPTTDDGIALLGTDERNSFQRFLFIRLFHAGSLLTKGGSSELLKLIKDQRFKEREIEKSFYLEYRAYREHLVDLVIKHNPHFIGTKGRLVRLTQKLIDRCIFVMFCEDMGEQLSFPPNALRDYLSDLSKSPSFEAEELDAWNKLKELFHAMNEGKKFRAHAINKFNGGLFANDAELDGLVIPNAAFCAKLQGENDTTLQADKLTLLYFAGCYNFGAGSRDGKAVTLYTLGRIFEQSITELEALEAAKEERESLTVISKRKRDGVYYTPEWVVERIVAETLGPRLDEIRLEVGWDLTFEGDEEAIKKQIALAPSKRSAAFERHEIGVRLFRDRLDSFTVLDPACGSGAFLIHTLEYLLRERRRVQRELTLVTGGKGASIFEFKADAEVKDILSKNIYGVDINPASVEIAQLALWLHTAKADQPLSNLDSNIVTGNSLVGEEVYVFKKDLLSAADNKKESINPFSYEKRFPHIFEKARPGGPGFDCVVGNPPYVKIQNFKKVYPETAEFLSEATIAAGQPRFRSCQTGSFDLYLPFIERGLELINTNGRLGYIAPSVWRFNKYGEGLKKLLLDGKHLSRWVDFLSFQVFDEATTYTALQFFTKAASTHVQIALAPKGVLADIPDWTDLEWRIDYKELSVSGPWVFASQTSRKLIKRMRAACLRLDDPKVSTDISQGLISGAFKIFANTKIGKDRYQSRIEDEVKEVAIESAACLPLISAEDIDPFLIDKPRVEIIFPYENKGTGLTPIPEADFKKRFPLAFAHLESNGEELKKRDGEKMKGENWYTFSRTQNLDKQSLPKIVIAGTGQRIEAALDKKGIYATNDKRVYSIYPKNIDDMEFLAGVLNSRACNFVFEHFARPKDGGYFDIEAQFLAPLPVPKTSAEEKDEVSKTVRTIEVLSAKKDELQKDLQKRFAACETVVKPAEWLWPSVRDVATWKGKAPSGLSAREKTAWAKGKRAEQISLLIDELKDRIRPKARLEVSLDKGELQIFDDGIKVLDSVFVDSGESDQTLFSWRQYFRLNPISDVPDVEGITKHLRQILLTKNVAIAKQIKNLDGELSETEEQLAAAETTLNNLIVNLYALTAADVATISSK
jgi:hypothetical protein